MRRSLRLLTWLYPSRFRDQFGEEMLHTLEQDLASRSSVLERGAFWLRSFGGSLTAAAREHVVDVVRDLVLVLRAARKRPMFFAIAILSMGLGIGAVATLLATIHSVFLTPLPGITEPERLVNVKPYSSHQESWVSASYPDYLDMVAGATATDALTGFIGITLVTKTSPEAEPEMQLGQVTTSNFLETVGAPVFRGRYFTAEEETSLTQKAFVSHHFWEQRLGAPDALGSLWVNGVAYEIVGVGAPGFRGLFKGFPSDIYLPLGAREALGLPALSNREARWLELVGRLAEGGSLEAAAADYTRLGEITAAEHAPNRDLSVHVEATTGLDADYRKGLAVFLSALLGVGLFVLAVAVLNVAGMMAARATDLRRNFAIRLALGAPRHRIARLVLAETWILGLLAAAVGLVLAQLGTRQVSSLFSTVDPRIHMPVEVRPSLLLALVALVLLVAFAAASFSGLTRIGRSEALGTRGTGDVRQRWRKALVVGQVVLSFVVLAAAVLLSSVLRQTAAIPLGFDPDPVAASTVNARLVPMRDAALFQNLVLEAEQIAGVERAALTNRVPLSLGARFFPNRATVNVPGHQPPEDADGFAVESSVVSAGYFETMSIPLTEGRAFDSREMNGQLAAVVNEAFARRFFSGESALGRTIDVGGQEMQIVGVAADTKARTLDEDETALVYLSFEQQRPPQAVLLAKATGDPALIPGDLRAVQRSVAPDIPVQELDTLGTRIASAVLPQRVGAAAAGALGLLGLLLSATGLYGVLAQYVSSRTAELGLRSSLGARPGDIVRLVLGQGTRLALLGVAIGLPLAGAVAVLMRSFLYGVSPARPTVYVAAAMAMLAASAVASLAPARKALRVSPMEALDR